VLYVALGAISLWLLSKHVIAAPDTRQIERAEALA
jgi:hypothetical protein